MSDSEHQDHQVELNSYIRRCAWVLVAVLCAIGLMIFASYLPHIGWPVKVAMILAIAMCNAFVVAGFLMHLLTEKRMIYTVLSFTVFFFAGLMGLTLWAMNDFPFGTAVH
jgi:FtsH-binding integral membrane protein